MMLEDVNRAARAPIALSTDRSHIIVCIDRPNRGRSLVQQGYALAHALNAPMTILQVLETRNGAICPDPVEWDTRRHEARRSLAQLASPSGTSAARAEIQLVEGRSSEEIARFLEERSDSLLVLGMQSSAGRCRGIGSTLHSLLDKVAAPMLLVPPDAVGRAPDYRRILVPIDGSPWAVSALPLAARLAEASGAELILAHVVPQPELTEIGPYDATDLELRERVLDRNARTARAYLERIRRNFADLGVNVRVICTQGDDVRKMLTGIIGTEGIDLVILSARGHGLCTNAEMPYGSVAGYLMTHSPVPLLLVKDPAAQRRASPVQHAPELRLPLLATA